MIDALSVPQCSSLCSSRNRSSSASTCTPLTPPTSGPHASRRSTGDRCDGGGTPVVRMIVSRSRPGEPTPVDDLLPVSEDALRAFSAARRVRSADRCGRAERRGAAPRRTYARPRRWAARLCSLLPLFVYPGARLNSRSGGQADMPRHLVDGGDEIRLHHFAVVLRNSSAGSRNQSHQDDESRRSRAPRSPSSASTHRPHPISATRSRRPPRLPPSLSPTTR